MYYYVISGTTKHPAHPARVAAHLISPAFYVFSPKISPAFYVFDPKISPAFYKNMLNMFDFQIFIVTLQAKLGGAVRRAGRLIGIKLF